MTPKTRALWGLLALIVIIAIGTIGYEAIEGWSFLDALWMTIITITTVGYEETHVLSTGGRIFSIFLIVGGVGGAIYAATGIIEYIVERYFGTTSRRRRMRARIAKLKGHFVLCGFGRVGKEIARTLNKEGIPFVVIDSNPERVEQAEQAEYISVPGNATSDETLRETGIENARGLVAAVGSDADNIYITLSARQLRPDLFIAARASSSEAETKLKLAGADRAVSPASIGGRRMAMLALRPAVVDFIDTVTYSGGRELQLENVDIGESSALDGMRLNTARSETGITILAIRKKGGRLIANPPEDKTIENGDRLIVIGTKKQLAALEEKCEGVKAS